MDVLSVKSIPPRSIDTRSGERLTPLSVQDNQAAMLNKGL